MDFPNNQCMPIDDGFSVSVSSIACGDSAALTRSASFLDSPFGYRTFGLYLISNLPIPWLVPALNDSGLPELRICLGHRPPGFEEAHYRTLWYSGTGKDPSGEFFLNIFRSRQGYPEGYWIKYLDGTQIFVGENASRIWVTWPAELSVEDVATYLLGPVMAIV